MLTTLLLPLLLQVGPNPSLSPPPAVPEELVEQRRIRRERQPAPLAPSPLVIIGTDPVQACAARAEADPTGAADTARSALARSSGMDRATAGHCLALALSAQELWPEAASALAEARAALPDGNGEYAARLSLAEAAARLAAGDAEAALQVLDTAGVEQGSPLASMIAVDRSRALVALGRLDEAAAALAQARIANPDNDEAWLLSATLSRRMGQLDLAQQQIERAAILRPAGPEIALEAGVIAVLAGRDEAALRSWQSVLESAPGTPAALTAADYIAQLRGQ